MRTRARLLTILATGVLMTCGPRPGAPPVLETAEREAAAAQTLVAEYLDRWLAFRPSRATAEGLHVHDSELEDFSPARLAAWLAWNHETARRTAALLVAENLPEPERLDLELLERRARTEIFDHEVLWRHETDPLFWSGTLANATVFLLVREDTPLEARLGAAARRAQALPRLVEQARDALSSAPAEAVTPEIVRLATRQVAAAATFYRESFATVAPSGALRDELTTAGMTAAEALETFVAFLETLAVRATGDPRLGDLYAESFRVATGVERPVDEVLAEAQEALTRKRVEAAAYGRSVWEDLLPGEPIPEEDRELVSRLLARAAQDRAGSIEAFVEDYRGLVARAIEFVEERRVMTLPEPFPIRVSSSPAYFAGQSVGGVYPPGPFAPAAETLLFVPTPAPGAGAQEREAFFRDFNHHFNVMITPHEIVPGHATQLVLAARHPRRVRALFADGVYVEGWGTFCERLLLDLGWGDPLARLAHLKKQMENIARTIVDIRVHTQGMTREEVLAFARDEAFQDEQFAANLWTRSITTTPQLTFYWLGYEQVMGLYEDVRAARGDAFELAAFMDGMMELGPVPVARYRERMLGRE